MTPSTGARAKQDMLQQPLSDAQGNRLNLIPVMPGLGVDITLTSHDHCIVHFQADAQALRILGAALTAAAEVAERVAQA